MAQLIFKKIKKHNLAQFTWRRFIFLIFLKVYISAQFIKCFVAVSKGFLFTKNIFSKSIIRRSLLGAVSLKFFLVYISAQFIKGFVAVLSTPVKASNPGPGLYCAPQ